MPRTAACPTIIDWESIADPAATTAVYMPGRTIAAFAAARDRGRPGSDTPPIAVAALGRAGERIVKARLGDIAHRLAQETLPTPLLVLIGRTLDRASQVDLARAADSEFGALAAPARLAGTPQENATS